MRNRDKRRPTVLIGKLGTKIDKQLASIPLVLQVLHFEEEGEEEGGGAKE